MAGLGLKSVNEEEFYEFLGILHSDGWMVPWKGEIGMEVIDRDFAERFRELCEKLSGKQIRIFTRMRERSTRYIVYLFSKELCSIIFERFGSTYTGKWKVPHDIITEPKNVICAYLRGVYAGDGCLASEKKRVKAKLIYTTKERENCEAIARLMSSIGITSRYLIRERKRKVFTNSFTSYSELIYYDYRAIRDFIELVGFPYLKRKQLVCEILNKRRRGNQRLPCTPKEKQAILTWMEQGVSNAIIAPRLGRTVDSIVGIKQRLKRANVTIS